MLHVKDSQPLHVNETFVGVTISSQVVHNHNVVNDTNNLDEFLHSFNSCFADKIPNELPPSRGEDDHRIALYKVVHLLIRLLIECLWPNKKKLWLKSMNF